MSAFDNMSNEQQDEIKAAGWTPQDAEPARTNGDFNRAAMKRYAMKVSTETRAGKFNRVSESFLVWLEAEIGSSLRKLRAPVQSHTGLEVECTEDFLTGAGKEKLIESFNRWIAGTIHRKTKDVRTGKTF